MNPTIHLISVQASEFLDFCKRLQGAFAVAWVWPPCRLLRPNVPTPVSGNR